jgi:TolB-like protein
MPDLLRDRLQASLGTAYVVERELGGGGMSHVFLAEETRFRRRVVVKLLPRELAGALSAERFEREIATAARLQHPHIVPVLGAGETDGLPYFTMPYVEGETLRARLARGLPELREAVAVLRDVAKALAYAHAHGVVHRDVKPENVLLTGGAATVTDFGVAKAIASSTHGDAGPAVTAGGLTGLGVALGTPAYMAPEQAAADPHLDARADLYAWGVVAYELFVGRPPFAGRSPSATMAAHVTEAPPALDRVRPGLPPQLVTLVMACLAKRPEDRPASAQAVLDALDGLATPSGGSPATGRVRTRGPAFAAVAALVLVAAGGAWFARGRSASSAPAAGRGRVVVAPLENLTGDPSLGVVGRMAADWITQGMAPGDSMEVVATATVAVAVADAKGSYAEMVRRLGASTGATALVSGSVIRRGDSLLLQAQLTDPRTGQRVGTMEPVSGPASDPMSAIQALRERVLGALATEGARWIARDWRERPPTFPAYREFMDGIDRFWRLQDYRGAIPYFERAVALDSTFVTALGILAVAHSNLGEYAAADSLSRRLEGMRDRMGPTDRTTQAWLRALLRGDWDETVRVQQTLAARDPTDPQPHYLIGFHALRRLRPDVAVPALLASDSGTLSVGWTPQISVLADAYHQAGRHADELATVQRGRRLFPAHRGILGRALRAHAPLRRATDARALADTVLATATDTLGRDLAAVLDGAAEFRAHGDSVTARALAARALAWHAAHPEGTLASVRAERAGRAWREVGRLDSAERYLAVAARDTACCAVAQLAAVRYARTGDRAALLRVADSLGASRQPWEFGRSRYAQAALVALVDRERALTILRRAVQEGYSMNGFHYAPPLAPLRGYPPFEQFVTPRR